ncbi:hypothetical protein [Phytomonospora endophytica]|uniref:Rubredoxin n=1 Tax=Phytomonospora endophytica TaxID=714109 RepID=A0A841FST0_9ACTN|nr:hypothetical protein [Phytomonospora endophytica]MBB6039335.1 rubredoxin [Phytomonospora endophytica]GIG69723.1 hypothetical protein Pen01_60180 [Phytomonospora endophytica]
MTDLTCPQCLASNVQRTTTAVVADLLCVMAPTIATILEAVLDDFQCGCGMHAHYRCGGCGLVFTTALPAEEISEEATASAAAA